MINKEAIIYTSLVKFVEHIAREKAGHNRGSQQRIVA